MDLLQDVAKDHKQKNWDSCIQTEDQIFHKHSFILLLCAAVLSKLKRL